MGEEVDPNKYSEMIDGVLDCIDYAFSDVVTQLAEPVLKIAYETNNVFPEPWGLTEEQTRQVKLAGERIRDEIYKGKEKIGNAIQKAREVCDDYSGSLHSRWGDAEHTASQLAAKCAELSSRIEFLEAQKSRRLREHNPSSPGLRANVLALTGGRCAYCDAEITSDSSDGNANFVIEHIVPKACGGPDHFANYVPACSKCNAQKSAGHVLEFIQRRLVSARVEIAEAAE